MQVAIPAPEFTWQRTDGGLAMDADGRVSEILGLEFGNMGGEGRLYRGLSAFAAHGLSPAHR
ncbi:hypothetical protein H206_05572 [Candidatus Electrothrix aarhusensis]|uniref:Uncharacterized protein n=1 Tax=Candidatus Electrothrix aarhusensis TaxID=1859131 RepID=A0A444J457_9BACT|nr:hypothetical protein H206_05572 [Candidatus Electrothrix aarhusensis]